MNNIIGFDALYESAHKCQKGVIWKDSVAHYMLNTIEETMKLENELRSGEYTPRPVQRFKITSPKPRDIVSISFRDRVYQRSLNDNALYPEITRHFIYDNWARQKGKGTDSARNRLKDFLRAYYRKHGCKGYVAQFDIRGYYPNMRHNVAEEVFQRFLENDAFNMARDVLKTQYDGDIGYNPGSQMVQIAGISVLDKLDHHIKERLRAKWYVRYMDGFLIIHESIEVLKNFQNEIEVQLKSIGFELNEKKTRVYSIQDGIQFLGFKFTLTRSGKVLMLADPKRVKSARLKYARLVKKSKAGTVSKKAVDDSFQSFISNIRKGNNYGLYKRLIEYYNHLWEV